MSKCTHGKEFCFECDEGFEAKHKQAIENAKDAEFDSNCDYLMEPMCNLMKAMGRDVNDFEGRDGTALSIFHDVINEFASALKPLNIIFDDDKGEYCHQAIAEAVQAVRDELELEIDALSDTFSKDLEQAKEETRQQCADAMSKLFVSRMHLLDVKTEFFITRADIDKAIRNSGKKDKGEGE